ncbi:MAG: hypothetical protein OHK006_06120 [Thermodesulfovibrionales bacterium]
MTPVRQSLPVRILSRMLSTLSTKEFLAWIIGAWIILYVSSMIWTKESFAYFVAGLKKNLIVQVPFILFLASGYLNLLRFAVPALKKGARRGLVMTVLPLGALLFLTGFFISASTRSFEWIYVKPGDVVRLPWSPEEYQVETIVPGLAERFLDIDIESGTGLFKYEPKVKIRDHEGEIFEVGAFPPAKIHGSYFHILNFGMAPKLSISENSVVRGEEYVPLRILGPGSVDTFEIQPLPYKFLLSLEPQRTIQKGQMKASEYDMTSPLYRIRVLEGETVIAEEVTKEGVRFKNFEIGFHEPGFWVHFEIVKDRGVLFILAGIFLTVAGGPLFAVGMLMKRA